MPVKTIVRLVRDGMMGRRALLENPLFKLLLTRYSNYSAINRWPHLEPHEGGELMVRKCSQYGAGLQNEGYEISS